jgi:hypothetical protein
MQHWVKLGARGWLALVGAATFAASACGNSDRSHTAGGRAGTSGSTSAGSSGQSGTGATAGASGSAGSTSGASGTSTGATSGAAAGEAGDTGSGGSAGGNAGSAGRGAQGGNAGTQPNGEGGEASSEGGQGGGFEPSETATQVDLLFVIDNSISMFEKQAVLGAGVPSLVSRLVNPWCVGPNGATPPSGGECPNGTEREMDPVRDMHVGVITTSIGDHGSGDLCGAASAGVESTYDDRASLLPFQRAGLDSWNASGFLKWDPMGVANPPGESDAASLTGDLRAMIEAAGDRGCGYEAPLEAMYRFLIDPEPPLTIGNDGNVTTVTGVDQSVLQQRAAFLRPNSALVIVMMSDENDCSILDEAGAQGWLVPFKGGPLANSWRMPRSTSACSADPNDADCRPCAESDSGDPSCQAGGTLTANEDAINLRCFQQKRRFGIDLLYPIDRYEDGLSEAMVPLRSGGLVQNPLFSGGRDPSLVLLTTIVGVPWQDVAVDPEDQTSLEVMSARALRDANRWPVIVGDFDDYAAPADPFMVESIAPRSGTNPVTGDAIAPAGSTDPTSTINGHESTPVTGLDDLQHACIFPLPAPIPCDQTNSPGCDCNEDELSRVSALCQEPGTGMTGTTQYFGQAYPGLRELELARRLGDRAIVSSICSRNTTSPSRDDYGYLPAMRAIQRHVTKLLQPN